MFLVLSYMAMLVILVFMVCGQVVNWFLDYPSIMAQLDYIVKSQNTLF